MAEVLSAGESTLTSPKAHEGMEREPAKKRQTGILHEINQPRILRYLPKYEEEYLRRARLPFRRSMGTRLSGV